MMDVPFHVQIRNLATLRLRRSLSLAKEYKIISYSNFQIKNNI